MQRAPKAGCCSSVNYFFFWRSCRRSWKFTFATSWEQLTSVHSPPNLCTIPLVWPHTKFSFHHPPTAVQMTKRYTHDGLLLILCSHSSLVSFGRTAWFWKADPLISCLILWHKTLYRAMERKPDTHCQYVLGEGGNRIYRLYLLLDIDCENLLTLHPHHISIDGSK